jgi:hypothetical protein
MFNVPYKIHFQTLNSNSAVSVKYLISPNYYIQIKKTTGTICLHNNTHERQEKSITVDDVVHRGSEALDDNVS